MKSAGGEIRMGRAAPGTPGCLSDLRIDMWLAGDLGAREQSDARLHVDGCAACAARVARIEVARAASVPDLEAIRQAAARRTPAGPRAWRRLWVPLGAVLVAAATAFVLTARAPEQPGGTRVKGRARLGFYVAHGDLVRRGGPEERVRPGDVVRFTASTAEPAHLAIIGVDAAGSATVYFPGDFAAGGAADAVPAGDDVELPRATVLDDTLGRETIYGFFCARPLDRAALESARSALLARPQEPPETPPEMPPMLPGCVADRIVIVKVGAP